MTSVKRSRKSIFFLLGICLLFIGFLLILYFQKSILGLGILLLSILLVIWSNENWKYKLFTIAPATLLMLFTLANSYVWPEIYLIPEGFKGNIYVVFNQEQGKPKEFTGLTRVYRIPENGILFTKFSANMSADLGEYYYVSKSGIKTKISDFSYKNLSSPHLGESPLQDNIVVFSPPFLNLVNGNENSEGLTFKISAVNHWGSIQTSGFTSAERIDSVVQLLAEARKQFRYSE
ncbi:DUF6843 domain-containing protein [Rufibacter tibetensis]|uniref:DUF6843 domain-containing protein n=1 Tax=Rufibacter tibetensis TaxID=512763 RepID=A0A0P0C9L8_9BACT|nr:hypothetical protein [Rufibacter tibetensis]ALI98140.1 hypothetical protein DC20_03045 [Rufibacter tibetensis]